MTLTYQRKAVAGVKAAIATASLAGGMLVLPQLASAVDHQTAERIAAGYAASPVPLNLTGKDPEQVGLGSYIVNGTGVCNHCHSVNQYFQAVYPQNYATQSGNPYTLPPPNGPYLGGILHGKATFVIDPSTFVAGGQNFGQFDSKNLTAAPDASVANPDPSTPTYPGGNIYWKTMWAILHNGVDEDQLVTQCSSGTTGPDGCVNSPTNAYVLQVMPWPVVRQLTDNDLNAVWQYLSAIPCTSNLANENGPSGSNIANTYGGGVLIADCLAGTSKNPNPRYKRYEYVNGKVVPKM